MQKINVLIVSDSTDWILDVQRFLKIRFKDLLEFEFNDCGVNSIEPKENFDIIIYSDFCKIEDKIHDFSDEGKINDNKRRSGIISNIARVAYEKIN